MREIFIITADKHFSYLTDNQVDELYSNFKLDRTKDVEHQICSYILSKTLNKKFTSLQDIL